MTALSIGALAVFIFGAYAYGALTLLSLRHDSPVWPKRGPTVPYLKAELVGLAMFVACTLWFVLHSIIEFRSLMGEARNNDFFDLAALELVFLFPGLILHTVLMETVDADEPAPRRRGWTIALGGLYAIGAVLAVYFPAAMFGLLPVPRPLGAYIGFSTGLLFTLSSACCIAAMSVRRRPAATHDQSRMRRIMTGMFAAIIALFFILSFMRDRRVLIEVLDVAVRTTPLAFLLVSMYFESRFQFYDLVIKRGVLLLISLLLLGSGLALGLGGLDRLAGSIARPWLLAVVLLPIAMVMPWLHSAIGRLLDRLWLGREFTPVEAIKHVLGAMQQATDEPSLVTATEATLSEMFRRRIVIVLDDQPVPDNASIDAELTAPSSATTIRGAVMNDSGARRLLSEDHALLRSLLGVFGFMLENVRLQRKRQEQEQVAQDLRLQTSRSELKALRAQINPHFLFNALNAIASLIHTDPSRADAAVEQLAEVFRYTLRRSESEWAPLDQELAFARAYLDVEQARFGRRLEYAIEADPALARAQVPSMLLQTLVENAVKHGISRLRAPGRITIRASRADRRLVLEVHDSGPGLVKVDGPATVGESFGLRSVRDRLQGHFGAQASLDMFRDGEVTVARIQLPFVEQPFHVAGAAR